MPQESFSHLPSNSAHNEFKVIKLFKSEITIVVLLLTVFVAANIATSSRLSTVWLDEVLLTDPAANLYLGHGFTSSAWYYQTKDEFWACNAPLHAVLLYHWMKLFGFSLIAVRSLNYGLMAISVLIIWLSVSRLNLVTSARSRIILVILLLLGEGVTFNYLSGRYDCLAISLFAAALFAYSIQSIWLRCILLLGIGIFIPIAGFHLLPYAAILGTILLIYLGRLFFRESISLTIGSTIGIIFLYILYSTNRVADIFFVKSLGGHSLGSAINKSKAPIKGSESDKIGYVLSNFIEIFANRLTHLPQWFFQDTSFFILLILALALATYQIVNANFEFRSSLCFGLVVSSFVPLGLGILRDYPNYYTWMSYIPLAICICSSVTKFRKTNYSFLGNLIILVSLVLACLPGYPMTLISGVQVWGDRDYAKVENFIATNVREDDKAYSSFGPYYAIKKRAASVFFPTYMDMISSQEKEGISVLIIQRFEKYAKLSVEDVINKLGGEWFDTKQRLDSREYKLMIFRRKQQIL